MKVLMNKPFWGPGLSIFVVFNCITCIYFEHGVCAMVSTSLLPPGESQELNSVYQCWGQLTTYPSCWSLYAFMMKMNWKNNGF